MLGIAQKQVAKAWYSETMADSKDRKHKVVTVGRDIANCDFKKAFTLKLLQQIVTSDNLMIIFPWRTYEKCGKAKSRSEKLLFHEKLWGQNLNKYMWFNADSLSDNFAPFMNQEYGEMYAR